MPKGDTAINHTYVRLMSLGMTVENILRYGKAIDQGWVVVMHDRDGGVDYLVLWPQCSLMSALMTFGVVGTTI